MDAVIIEIGEARKALKASRSKAEEELERQFRLRRLPHWEREYLFAQSVGRKFRADFAFVSDRILIEVEGGVFSGGRHTRGAGFTEDCVKYNTATVLGWRVLRVTPAQVKSGMALKWAEDCLLVKPA